MDKHLLRYGEEEKATQTEQSGLKRGMACLSVITSHHDRRSTRDASFIRTTNTVRRFTVFWLETWRENGSS